MVHIRFNCVESHKRRHNSMARKTRRPIVTTSDGKLMGIKAYTTTSGTQYYAFKGIPFAKPPVGDLRFMAPEPVEPWDGLRDATYERNVCYQPNVMTTGALVSSFEDSWVALRSIPRMSRLIRTLLKESEDCLYLNIYTPKLPSSDAETINLPVLFKIHGGAFLLGSGSECSGKIDHLIDRGVLVVSINYRLGPFGFLSLDTPSAPGNAGMKDQVQALKWVQRNISKFGGDPNRVTLYGISAGGASGHLLTVSPLAKGLFHGVYAGSGVGLCDWSVRTDHVEHATEFAKALRIKAETTEELAIALKKVSSADIMRAFAKYKIAKKGMTMTYGPVFVPCIERRGPDAFLVEHPELVLREGRQAPVPLVAGVVANEGTLWYMFPPIIDVLSLNQEREMLMPLDLYHALSPEQREEVGNQIVEFYCGKRGICKETEEQFITLYGDISFVVKCILTCRICATTSSAPVYLYRFSFDGQVNGFRGFLKGKPCKGPGHADDAGHMMPMIVSTRKRLKSNDPRTKVARMLSEVVANFAKSGNPTKPNNVNYLGEDWNPITEKSMDYLDMGFTFKMKHDKFGPRLRFWNDLYKKYLNCPILPDDCDIKK